MDTLDGVVEELRKAPTPELDKIGWFCAEGLERDDVSDGLKSVLRWLAHQVAAMTDQRTVLSGLSDEDLEKARQMASLLRGTSEFVEVEGTKGFHMPTFPSDWSESAQDVWNALIGALTDERTLRSRSKNLPEGTAEIENGDES